LLEHPRLAAPALRLLLTWPRLLDRFIPAMAAVPPLVTSPL
jgi:hypothetical protein